MCRAETIFLRSPNKPGRGKSIQCFFNLIQHSIRNILFIEVIMLIKRPGDISSSEITPEAIYNARRDFMRGGFNIAAGFAVAGAASATANVFAAPTQVADKDLPGPDWLKQQIAAAQPNKREISENITPYEHITGYNNFYEYGYNKTDP